MRLYAFFLALQGVMSLSLLQAQNVKEHPYRLVWSDEFNYVGQPDSTKWDYERGFIRNKEPQWYQPENAHCDGQYLIIEARKERKKNPKYDPLSADWRSNREYAEYTSACLITLGKFEFTYGKVVMRAKIDIRKAMWPAFWMLGKNRGPVKWPACGEVDIMEFYRGNLLGNWFWEGQHGAHINDVKIPVLARWGQDWANAFHECVLEWDKSTMRISVDGEQINVMDLSKTINYSTKENPYHKPFYLLLNIALGQGGEEIPDENLPASMLVDYVRVYQ